MKLVEVKTKRELIEFIRVPWRIYKRDPNWVAPIVADLMTVLNREKNPFFKHADASYFYILDDYSRPVGRIAAIYDRFHYKYRGENIGFFGYFESFDDLEVVAKLFEVAEEWVFKKGAVGIRGPINLSMNNECGLLIEGFDDPPMFMMPYNPPYYRELIEKNGYKKVKDLYAYWIDIYENPPTHVFKFAEKVISKGRFTVRNANMRRFKEELVKFKEVFNDAWTENWGFVPLTDEEIEFMAKRLKPLVVKDLTVIAEVDGEPVGVGLAVPDYNFVFKKMKGSLFPLGIIKFFIYKNQIPRARLMVLGVKKGYRFRGVEIAMIAKLLDAGLKRGYYGGELSWTLEDNHAINSIIERFGGRLYKKYRIFEKAL